MIQIVAATFEAYKGTHDRRTIIAAIPPTLVAAAGLAIAICKINAVHRRINGRFSQPMDEAKKAAFAEGVHHEKIRNLCGCIKQGQAAGDNTSAHDCVQS